MKSGNDELFIQVNRAQAMALVEMLHSQAIKGFQTLIWFSCLAVFALSFFVGVVLNQETLSATSPFLLVFYATIVFFVYKGIRASVELAKLKSMYGRAIMAVDDNS